MINKKLLLTGLFIFCVLILFFSSKFLSHYFYLKSKDMEISVFNNLLKQKAKSQIFANYSFFNCETPQNCCKNIDFFIKKFKIKNYKITPIYSSHDGLFLKGCELEGVWQSGQLAKKLKGYFYYCAKLEVPEWNKKNISVHLLLTRKVNALEVVGKDNFYEVYGSFFYIKENKFFVQHLAVIPRNSLQYFEIKSKYSGKTFLIGGSYPSFIVKMKYAFYNKMFVMFSILSNLRYKVTV